MLTKLLRLLLLVGLLGSAHLPGRAQQAAASDTGNPLRELHAALAGLNPTRITTGVLLDRTMLFTNPHRFAGQGDTAASYNGFEQQYGELYNAALDNSQLPTLAAMRSSIAQQVQQGSVPLLMLNYTYNELLATAARDQLITIDSVNERVFDGPNLSQSPYRTGELFSTALPLPVAAGVLRLYVGAAFWLGNTAAPASVFIDFGDGYGAREVAMGTTIEVQVASGPVRQPPVIIKNRGQHGIPPPAMRSGGTLLVSHPTTGYTAAATLRTATLATTRPDVALGLVASQRWGNFVPQAGRVSGPDGRASAIAWINTPRATQPGSCATRSYSWKASTFQKFAMAWMQRA